MMTESGTSSARGRWGLVALFSVSGVMHFVRPQHFESIVPRQLPAKRELVYASGAVELGCAAGLALPATRRWAGLASVGLLLAVFPANVQMAADLMTGESPVAKALGFARLPMQIPMVRTAWRVFNDGRG